MIFAKDKVPAWRVLMGVLMMLVVSSSACFAQGRAPWWNKDWKYRAPIQVKNLGDQPTVEQAVRFNFPVRFLSATGKLRADSSDIQLVDEGGKVLPSRALLVEGDAGAVAFTAPALAAKTRRNFYLYYGNPQAKIAPTALEVPQKNPDALLVTVGGEERLAGVAPRVHPQNVEQWLKRHKAEEFKGQVWARVKMDEPKDFRYNVIVDTEINPYAPERRGIGTLSYYGLQPKPGPVETGMWHPLAWIAPGEESEWLRTGEYSAWVALPISQAAQWRSAFFVRPREETASKQVTLHLEFATQPDEDYIFHVVDERADDAGATAIRMPTEGGLAGLNMLESGVEWSRRRREMATSLKLPPAPRLKKFRVGTWAQSETYRIFAGSSTPQRVEQDFQSFAEIGINSVSASGLSDQLFRQFATKYGIIDTTLGGWTDNWRHSGAGALYDWQPAETVAMHWTRVFDDYYRKLADSYKKDAPFAFSIAQHVNLGDEIGVAINAEAIRSTPQILSDFRQWLQAQKKGDATWTPQLFGAKSWNEVDLLDDRARITVENPSADDLRRFYWTWRFINHYTVLYYKAATTAVRKHFPRAKLIAANYQAGPVQNGFIGGNNDMDKGNLDIFELGRQGAFQGAMLEDWAANSDIGSGFVAFGADVIRAAVRKRGGPLAAYLVGHEPRSRFYAWMMQDIKEIGLYLYGPSSNIGPAWAEHSETLRQIAEVTREVKKFENEIVGAKLRPTRVALLVAHTSDIMQARGLYFPMERQQLYIALRHSGVPVDIISEGEVDEDDILKNYSLLFVSDPQVRTSVQRKVAAWVKGGGRLWTQVGAMNWDEYSQPSSIMHEVLGVKQNEMKIQPGGINWAGAFYATSLGKMNFSPQGKFRLPATLAPAGAAPAESEVIAWGMRAEITPTTGKVLSTFEDGKAAIVANSHGRGETVLVGALVGEAYVRTHWAGDTRSEKWKFDSGRGERLLAIMMLRGAGIQRPLDISVPGIYSSVMEAPGATLVFLNNATGQKVPKLTLRLRDYKGLKSSSSKVSPVQEKSKNKKRGVESAKGGEVTHRFEKDDLVVEMALPDSDIICVYHGK